MLWPVGLGMPAPGACTTNTDTPPTYVYKYCSSIHTNTGTCTRRRPFTCLQNVPSFAPHYCEYCTSTYCTVLEVFQRSVLCLSLNGEATRACSLSQ
jgi:hypothetical protein